MYKNPMQTGVRLYTKTVILTAILAVALLVSGLMPLVSYGAEDGPEKVRVGYYENEVFQEGASKDAVKKGYAYEYYRKISEYTGWEYEYVYGEFGDLYQMLIDGKIDLLAGLARKEDREKLIGYPEAAMGDETYSLVKHDFDDDVTSDPKTLKGKKIGILDSAMVDVLEKYLKSSGVTADLKKYNGYEKLYKDFDEDKIDVLAAEGDGAYGRSHASVLGIFGHSEYYLCVNKKRQDLLRELDQAQTELYIDERNYIQSLRSKYYSTSMSSRGFSPIEKEWLENNKSITVGFLKDYLPYSDDDNNGDVTGIVKDIVPRIMRDLHLDDMKISFKGFDSYSEMTKAVADGKIDVAFPVGGGLFYSEENGMYQSNPVVSSAMQLIFQGDYSENTTAKFAVNENNMMQYYYIKTNFPESETVMYGSIDECLKAVKNGEATCTTLNGLRANGVLKNSDYSGLSMQQMSHGDTRCFGVRIGNEGLLKVLNHGINIVGEDYAMSLSYKYTEGLYKYTLTDMLRDNMGIFIGLIALIAAMIIFFLVRESMQTKAQVKEKENARLTLEQKNRELAENKEALTKALEAAESANRAKTSFLNSMSHDIRTPMNAIVGFTKLAEKNVEDSEAVSDYLDKISVSSAHLLSLINDVLDMSRIESGKVTIEEENMSLTELIDGLTMIVRESAGEKNQKLTVEMDITHKNVMADKLRLSQVLLNILSNAVKYTPEGGEINLTLTERPGAEDELADYEFKIKDNGIGMSDEFRDTIFEAFTREQTSTVSGIQGTGLGMAITKNIVDLMGGTISVESSVGKGSEFTVDLSLKTVEAGAEEKVESEDVDFTGKTVLLAEDNELNQQIAVAILEDVGLTVDIAGDGTVAVAKMEEAPAGTFDVILMDIQMPKMDGYEAARKIRALDDPAKAGIPIIAVTANAFEEDRQSALDAGMNGHLAKPYDIPKMMKALKEILG